MNIELKLGLKLQAESIKQVNKFLKSKISLEVGGWVQVSLGKKIPGKSSQSRANLFKSQAVGDIWLPQIWLKFFLVEGIWVDRKIPNLQVPRPNGFFSTAFRKKKFWGEI